MINTLDMVVDVSRSLIEDWGEMKAAGGGRNNFYEANPALYNDRSPATINAVFRFADKCGDTEGFLILESLACGLGELYFRGIDKGDWCE